jgi:galactonate dehydratase
MKITNIELFKVPPRWVFVKVETDEGITGWGEPIMENRADTVMASVTEWKEYLIGKDPMRIEDHYQVMTRSTFYRSGPILSSTISGIEQALWDIKGKYYDAPIYDLLGGACRDKMRVYGWVGGDRPNNVAEAALKRVAEGLTAIKMNATEEMNYIDSFSKVTAAVDRLAAVREACGPDFGIGLDFHGRVHKAMAKVLVKEMEPYHPMFIEEPVLPENLDTLKQIALHTTIPIATGERMYTRWGFKQLLQEGYVDIIQPDLSHCGGIWEARKLAAMAETFDVAVAPHCPLGPMCLASSLQLDFCTPNAIIQEQSLGIHYNKSVELVEYVKNPDFFKVENGYIKLPTTPGLGIEIDEEKVREAAKIGHNYRAPIWRYEDGGYAER